MELCEFSDGLFYVVLLNYVLNLWFQMTKKNIIQIHQLEYRNIICIQNAFRTKILISGLSYQEKVIFLIDQAKSN